MESIAQKRCQIFLPFPNNYLFLASRLSFFPLTHVLPAKLPNFVRLKATASLTCDDQQSNRKFQKLLPSPWTDHFHSVFVDVSEMDALRKEMDVLKMEVKNTTLIMSSQDYIESVKRRILMVYLLVSLGLACQFEDEISEILKDDFGKLEEMMDGEDDLYTVSIIFWVFRRYGHHMSSDVFKRFKSKDGNFKESLIGDAKGLLSLYEATHMRTTKEDIMEEALIFTSNHLESLAAEVTCPPHLSKYIQNALSLPQHWNMEMLVPPGYIPFYEQEEDHDKMLLKFAKISFKLVQLQYLQEVKILVKWGHDDTMDKQPHYLKFVLNTIINIFQEFKTELELDGRSDNVSAAIEQFKTHVRSNFDLAKWAAVSHVPSYEEYMEVGEEEVAVRATLSGMYMTMGNMVSKEGFEWLKSNPKLVTALCTKSRLMDDTTGFEDDMSRGYVTNSVSCYMKQYRVSEKEAIRELNKMVVEAEKMINEEYLTTIGVQHCILKAVLGLTRMIHVCYNVSEGYTHPVGKIKEYMTSIFDDQIPLN